MKINKLHTLIAAIILIVVISIFIDLNARGGGGGRGGGGRGGGGRGGGARHGGGGHRGGGGRGHGGHGRHGGGYGRGGYGRGGYGRGGWGYGGWGFGTGLGLGFALGYPGYWSNGYYYNSDPIIIDNTTYTSGQACWSEDKQQWVLCNSVYINV